jgi:hypothetical protein
LEDEAALGRLEARWIDPKGREEAAGELRGGHPAEMERALTGGDFDEAEVRGGRIPGAGGRGAEAGGEGEGEGEEAREVTRAARAWTRRGRLGAAKG